MLISFRLDSLFIVFDHGGFCPQIKHMCPVPAVGVGLCVEAASEVSWVN